MRSQLLLGIVIGAAGYWAFERFVAPRLMGAGSKSKGQTQNS